MTESNHSQVWVAIAAGVAVFAAATWFIGEETSDRTQNTPRETPQAEPAASPGMSDPPLRIAQHGRLSLDLSALPEEGPLSLVLDLPDEARGQGLRTLRIVSTDGRRIDTTASPLAGTGTGVQVDIEPGFLTRGLYMIEIDTEEKTALQIRRYVLELN